MLYALNIIFIFKVQLFSISNITITQWVDDGYIKGFPLDTSFIQKS